MTAPSEPPPPRARRIPVMRLPGRRRQERDSSAGLTASQLAAMATLRRHGPLTAGELASHEKVSPPSMTRILGHLSDLGMVERRSSPADGRQVLVELSDDGRRLLAADQRRRDEWLSGRLQELSESERTQLLAVVPILD